MNRKMLVASATAFAMMTAAVFAHEDAVGVVKERMDAMSSMGKAMKVMSAMMRGNKPMDSDMISSSASIIFNHSGNYLTKLFPEGSNEHPSQVRGEIWTNWGEFNTLADQLNKLAKGMELSAENGLMTATGTTKKPAKDDKTQTPSPQMLASMPIDAVFNMMAKTCSSCHRKFRNKKN